MAKTVPLSPEVSDQIREADKRFRALFGRRPGRGDKLLFEQYLSQGDELWSEVRQVGKEAGIDERFLYATQRTDLFLSDRNIDLVSAQDLEEWDAACAEYDELKELGVDPFNALDFASPEEYELFKGLSPSSRCIPSLGAVRLSDLDASRRGGQDFASCLPAGPARTARRRSRRSRAASPTTMPAPTTWNGAAGLMASPAPRAARWLAGGSRPSAGPGNAATAAARPQ
jgi:hypothetical protein